MNSAVEHFCEIDAICNVFKQRLRMLMRIVLHRLFCSALTGLSEATSSTRLRPFSFVPLSFRPAMSVPLKRVRDKSSGGSASHKVAPPKKGQKPKPTPEVKKQEVQQAKKKDKQSIEDKLRMDVARRMQEAKEQRKKEAENEAKKKDAEIEEMKKKKDQRLAKKAAEEKQRNEEAEEKMEEARKLETCQEEG